LTTGIGRVTGGVPPATRMMGGFRVAHFFVQNNCVQIIKSIVK
jgi:hypothetical protein